jgi:hypothetical protein
VTGRPADEDVEAVRFEKALANLATGGTIVCRDCNASDVTDSDHRAHCAVWGVRHAVTTLLSVAVEGRAAAEQRAADAEKALWAYVDWANRMPTEGMSLTRWEWANERHNLAAAAPAAARAGEATEEKEPAT